MYPPPPLPLPAFLNRFKHLLKVLSFKVLAAAQAGYQAIGYELNLWLVLYSKITARLKGLHRKASFSRADLWKVMSNVF